MLWFSLLRQKLGGNSPNELMCAAKQEGNEDDTGEKRTIQNYKLYPKKINSCASDNDSRPLPVTLILVWRCLGVTSHRCQGALAMHLKRNEHS